MSQKHHITNRKNFAPDLKSGQLQFYMTPVNVNVICDNPELTIPNCHKLLFCQPGAECWGQVRGLQCLAGLEFEITCSYHEQSETFYGQPSPCTVLKFIFLFIGYACMLLSDCLYFFSAAI